MNAPIPGSISGAVPGAIPGPSWLTDLAVFVLVALCAYHLQLGLSGLVGGRRRRRERLDGLGEAGLEAGTTTLLREGSRLEGVPFLRALDRLVLQSGTRASPALLGSLWLGLGLLAALLLPAPDGLIGRLLVGLLGAGLSLLLWLRVRRARRLARFGEQLPDMLDIVVRSLRAGHPLPVSLALVAREMPEPAGPEFQLLVDEVSYGRSVTEALDNLYRRVGYPELRFFVASAAIAHQTGGNLGEILSRLSRMLRERFRLMRRVRALTAEGRVSGIALSLLPVILFALINLVSPAYYAEFWASDASSRILLAALGLLALGNVAIYRLVNLKV